MKLVIDTNTLISGSLWQGPPARNTAVIYLDYNATMPVWPQRFEAMMPYLTSEWGNSPNVLENHVA